MAQQKVTFCLTNFLYGLVGSEYGLVKFNVSSVTYFLDIKSPYFEHMAVF
jgi:hypothetical protein